MLEKARGIDVDEVVIDLEDAVVPDRKAEARADAVAALDGGLVASVRVNAPGTPWAHDDLVALARAERPPRSVVVPKVHSAGDLAVVDRVLDGTALRVQALIESAKALRALDEIAAASPRLDALILGYADLGVSLGRSRSAPPDRWLAVQDAVLTAARAAGLQAIDGPLLTIDDLDALRGSAAWAAELGFDGKWAIHPSQIAPITAAFTPTGEEVARARAVLAALAEAAADGRGAVSLDGEMLDEPVRLAAERVVARAGG
jgi:citrate lyase subunit beta / citryl-CoA lyase